MPTHHAPLISSGIPPPSIDPSIAAMSIFGMPIIGAPYIIMVITAVRERSK